MNHVSLVGRLGGDPELQYTQNGIAVCTLRLAIRNEYVRAGEERGTTWITVKCWRQSAEYIANYARKGSTVTVLGHLKVDQWNAEDGTTKRFLYVEADSIRHLGHVTTKSDDPGAAAGGPETAAAANTKTGASTDDTWGDPF